MNADSTAVRPGALAGVRVLDLTSIMMGPFATQILGDMGADVIKVEPPSGDMTRGIRPHRHAGMGPIFLNTNRNKRSLCIDLKSPAGLRTIHRLIRQVDVVISNIRPEAMARLKLGYDDIALLNPAIINVALVGFASGGPYSGKPAYDDLIQGGSVLASLFAQSGGEPRYVPTAIADRVSGLAAVNAVTSALYCRERTGQGQSVEVPMFETMLSIVLGDHLGGLTFQPPLDGGGYRRQLSPDKRPYLTADGFVCVVVYTDEQWARFLAVVGEPHLMTDDKRFSSFGNRDEHSGHVTKVLSGYFAQRTTQQWVEILTGIDIPVIPMHDLSTILEDQHLVATAFFEKQQHPSEGEILSMAPTTRFSAAPSGVFRPAPGLGQHSRELLLEAGLTAEEIDALVRDNIVCTPDAKAT